MRRRARLRLKRIGFAVLVAALLPAVVVLLPILLPVALAADALEMRRLARSRCVACGAPIGLSEIRRAREAAQAKARAIVSEMQADGIIPRVVVDWEVTCPTCRQAYVVPQGGARSELVIKA